MFYNMFFKILVASILLLAIFGLIGYFARDDSDYFRERIINEINSKCQIGETCEINMDTFIDSEWNKMVIYFSDVSDASISEALGVEYKSSGVFKNGIIFANDTEIVFEDYAVYNPDNPEKFDYFVENSGDFKNYSVFTRSNAVLIGKKQQMQGYIRYVLCTPTSMIQE